MGTITTSNLDDVFSYHKPKNDFQIEKYHRIRQAAKACAKVMLDTQDQDARVAALDKFGEQLAAEIGGECVDAREAMSLLAAGKSFVAGLAAQIAQLEPGPEADAETTASVIQCIRAATMWANASVALEGRV